MTPARLLAPVALVAAAIALFAVLSSGSDDSANKSATPSATAAPSSKKKATATATAKPGGSGKTYTVKPGDTPSGIAEKENVDVDDLLKANPDVDADALTVGDELKLP